MSIEKVKPITLTDTETGKVYTLEFNRKIIARMERQGFIASNIADFPVTAIPTLFNGAFQLHHSGITMDETDKLWAKIADTSPVITRLSALYNEPIKALLGTDDEGESERKNSTITVDM